MPQYFLGSRVHAASLGFLGNGRRTCMSTVVPAARVTHSTTYVSFLYSAPCSAPICVCAPMDCPNTGNVSVRAGRIRKLLEAIAQKPSTIHGTQRAAFSIEKHDTALAHPPPPSRPSSSSGCRFCRSTPGAPGAGGVCRREVVRILRPGRHRSCSSGWEKQRLERPTVKQPALHPMSLLLS